MKTRGKRHEAVLICPVPGKPFLIPIGIRCDPLPLVRTWYAARPKGAREVYAFRVIAPYGQDMPLERLHGKPLEWATTYGLEIVPLEVG